MATVYIGIGSNLGNREDNIRTAVSYMGSIRGVMVRRCSPLHETEPEGGPPQGRFLNAAAELLTNLSPHDLLDELQEIEEQLGRVRTEHWGPRTIDLDILLYGDQTIFSDDLRVPHPLMHERAFVLEPLAEIAPQAVHPASGLTVDELWKKLNHTVGH